MSVVRVAALGFVLAGMLAGCESSPTRDTRQGPKAQQRTATAPPAEALPPDSRPPVYTVDLDVTDASVAHVLNEISRQIDVSIVLEGETDSKVTLSLRKAPWRDVLAYICHRARLKIRRDRNLIILVAPPRNTLQAEDADASTWLRLLARQGGNSIIMPGGMHERISEELHDIPWDEALRITAETYGYTIETVK